MTDIVVFFTWKWGLHRSREWAYDLQLECGSHRGIPQSGYALFGGGKAAYAAADTEKCIKRHGFASWFKYEKLNISTI
ncbi:hypothetical protein [Pararhizobium sp. DWP3-4]|uniref:hypothetical protein n=1 Tax=Pararhizobium sp. DWP3-4 TaxID=2804565 RepID=UPI003CEB2507